jgi:hypothetical protein
VNHCQNLEILVVNTGSKTRPKPFSKVGTLRKSDFAPIREMSTRNFDFTYHRTSPTHTTTPPGHDLSRDTTFQVWKVFSLRKHGDENSYYGVYLGVTVTIPNCRDFGTGKEGAKNGTLPLGVRIRRTRHRSCHLPAEQRGKSRLSRNEIKTNTDPAR